MVIISDINLKGLKEFFKINWTSLVLELFRIHKYKLTIQRDK